MPKPKATNQQNASALGFSDPKSEWFIKDEPQRTEAADADSFRHDLHPDLKADFILANPPFNMSDWGGENLRQDVRWKFGMPPVNKANYA